MAAESLVLSTTMHSARKIPRPDILDEFDLQLWQVKVWRKEGKDPEDMPEWAQKIDSAARLVQREWRQKSCRRYRGGLKGLLEGDTGPCDGPAMIRTPWGWMPVNDPWIVIPEKADKSKETAASHGSISHREGIYQSSGPGNESNDPEPKQEGSGGDAEGAKSNKKEIQARYHGRSVISKLNGENSATNAPCSLSTAGRPETLAGSSNPVGRPADKECLGGGNRKKPKRKSIVKHGLKSGHSSGNAGMSKARVKESLDVVLNLRRDFLKWRDSYWKLSKVAKKASTSFHDAPSAAEFARWTATMKLHVVALVDSMAAGTPVGRAFLRDSSHLIKVAKKLGKLLHDQNDVDAGITAFHKFDKAMQENGYICGAVLVEIEEWTEAMVGKLEGMLRDCNGENKTYHLGAAGNHVAERTAVLKSDTVETRDGSEESSKKCQIAAAANDDVKEQAADAKPDTVLNQVGSPAALKKLATQQSEEQQMNDVAQFHCSSNTAHYVPDAQNEPLSVGTPEGGALLSHAAASAAEEEQRASGHRHHQNSVSEHHQCRGTRRQEEGERLTEFEKTMLSRGNEISGVSRNYQQQQQQQQAKAAETCIPPRRQSKTSVVGGSHSKRSSLEASAPSSICRDTFASALPRKPSATRASMEDNSPGARSSSLGDLPRQPHHERAGDIRRQPARISSLDSSSMQRRRHPNGRREDASPLPEDASCGSDGQHHQIVAASPIHGSIEQPWTPQPNHVSSRPSPSRMAVSHAEIDEAQDSFAFAAPTSSTSTVLLSLQSRSSGEDSATCSVSNTPFLPPLVAAPPKETGAAATANELHPALQRNRNSRSTQGGLSSDMQGDGRLVARLGGRQSMDVGSAVPRVVDSAHQQQQEMMAVPHHPVDASLFCPYMSFKSHSQASQQDLPTAGRHPHPAFNWKHKQGSMFDGIITRQQDLMNHSLRSSQTPLKNLTLPGGKVLF